MTKHETVLEPVEIEAMRDALAFLSDECGPNKAWRPYEFERFSNAIKTLSNGLAALPQQAEQVEPVAWLIDWPDEPELGHYFAEEPCEGSRCRPLYTTPPASRALVEALEDMVARYGLTELARAALEAEKKGQV